MLSTAGKWCYLCKRKGMTRLFVSLTWELPLLQSSSRSKQCFTSSTGNSITCIPSGQSYTYSSRIWGKRCFPAGLKDVSLESSVWDYQTRAGLECQIVSNRVHELFNKMCVCGGVTCCQYSLHSVTSVEPLLPPARILEIILDPFLSHPLSNPSPNPIGIDFKDNSWIWPCIQLLPPLS